MRHQELIDKWELGDAVELHLSQVNVPELAFQVARVLRRSDWLLLEGDLGAGKTTLVAQLAYAMGAKQRATSPTFSLLNVIQLESSGSLVSSICHMDLYRVKRSQELQHLGLELEMTQTSIAVIEWSENIEPEGWCDFFQVTRCKKPVRIPVIKIAHEENKDLRFYSLSWKSLDEFLFG